MTVDVEVERTKQTSLSRNAALNLGGAAIPLVITLVTVPPYLRLIGDVRFGVLSLVWVLLGYFSLFEMGLGRATSKYIAQLRDDVTNQRETIFWTAALVNLGIGILGGLALWGVGVLLPFGVSADDPVHLELARGMLWLAIAVPVATVTSVLVGALEGCEKFGIINSQQIGATILFQLAPLSVAYWVGPRLDWLIAAAVLARLAANIPLFFACARHLPLVGWPRIDRAWIRRLFSFGVWVTVSGIVGPILTSLDRFIIGFFRGAQAVTYYAIPYNFSTKLSIIPYSVQRALFPRFSAQDSSEARDGAIRAVSLLAAVFTPIVVIVLLLTRPFFELWIGPSAAARSTTAGEIMMLGVWTNGILALVPYVLLQAQGRPDLTAKFHLLELPPFIALLWAGVHFGGVVGAAIVYDVRCTADGLLLLIAAGILRPVAVRLVSCFALLSLTLAASLMVGDHLLQRSILLIVLGGISLYASYLSSPELVPIMQSHFGWLAKVRPLSILSETTK